MPIPSGNRGSQWQGHGVCQNRGRQPRDWVALAAADGPGQHTARLADGRAEDCSIRRGQTVQFLHILRSRSRTGFLNSLLRCSSYAHVLQGHFLTAVEGIPAEELGREGTLQHLCRCSDDSDTTEDVAICFGGPLNSTEVQKLMPLVSAKETKKEIQVDAPAENLLRWPCRANCGSIAERKLNYNGALPKAVFCSKCSQKRRDSWRARVCRAVNCKSYVKYHVFELQVLIKPEPELCSACSKLEGVVHKEGEDLWRMKKCQECRRQMEFYLPDEPVACSDCTQKAPVSSVGEVASVSAMEEVVSDTDSEPEDSDAEWSLVSESWPSVAEYLSKEVCEECSAQVTEKGLEFTCQSAKHCFFLCGSKGCLKKFEKQCEDAAAKRGKSGKKKIDFAKHRGSSPCPSCGLLLTEGPVKRDQECLISGTGPTCFPYNTLLIVPGPDGALKPIQTFRPNDMLISAQGHAVRVKAIQLSEEGDQERTTAFCRKIHGQTN